MPSNDPGSDSGADVDIAPEWGVIVAIASWSMESAMSEGSAPTDALLHLAQAQSAEPPPHAAAHWVSYGGGQAILLAIALLVVAGVFAAAGKRLRVSIRV